MSISLESPTYSPWGAIQSREQVADGIESISTASHGGYWLSRERRASFVARFPDFTPFAGLPWFEEDCDWAAVVLAFPIAFNGEAHDQAKQLVCSMAAWQPDRHYFGQRLEALAGGVA